MNATTTEPKKTSQLWQLRTKSEGYGRGTNESLWLQLQSITQSVSERKVLPTQITMNLKMDSLVKRLDFLYRKLEEIDEESPLQKNYLLSEIDKQRTLLLELEVEQEYEEIDEQ